MQSISMLATRAMLLSSVVACPAALWAQDAAPAPVASNVASTAAAPVASQAPAPSGLSDIIVTAQRRAENVQNIPVAISAFGAKQLQTLGVISVENIAPRVPSVYFGSFGSLRPQLYIRGIGTRSFDPGSESSVGVFVDDVYLGRSSGSFSSLKDLDRVEVLRGPQGTLYGRNTIAGAVNLVTKGPTPDFHAEGEAGVSNYGGWNVFGAVGGPVTANKDIQFRITGWHDERDGYVTNLTTGHKFQGVDNTGVRGRLLIKPVDRLKISLEAEYLHDGNKEAFDGFNQGKSNNPNAVFIGAPGLVPVAPESLFAGEWNIDPSLNRNAYSYIGRIDYDADFATLTSITAFKKLDVRDSRDLDGSSLDTINQFSNEHSKQFTQEIRLTSNRDGWASFGGKLDWIVGAFYYRDTSNRTDTFPIGVDSVFRRPFGTPAVDATIADYGIRSYAAFGQATLHIGEKIDLTVGARYSKDDKDARQIGTTTDALPPIRSPFDVFNKKSFHSFDPRFVATYRFNPHVNVYASYSTGFKSGGFQYTAFSAAIANQTFQPEKLKAYEIGLKSEFFNHTLRFNAAGFYYDYKNLQLLQAILVNGAPLNVINNAASSTIKGVELEATIQPSRDVQFNVSYGYTNGKYNNYITGQFNFGGTQLVRSPRNTVNVGGQWDVPIGPGKLTLRADYALLSDIYFDPGQGEARFGAEIPLTAQDGYGLLDLRAIYQVGPYRFTAYATNVTNTVYRRTTNTFTGSAVVGYVGQPRIVGFKAAFSF